MSPVVRWTAEPLFNQTPAVGKAEREAGSRTREWTRRVLNVSVAAGSLILASPLFLLIAAAVRVSSPGPISFAHDRVGLDKRRRAKDRRARGRGSADRRQGDTGGKVFRMYKFRTMYSGHGGGPQVWAKKDDPRITPVGRILRAFRLDELPQLWNVLLGQMNIVGPRPEQPEIFQELREEIDGYQRRQRVLPGITGLAQITNGYDQTFRDVERKLGYDLEYLEKRSAGEDARIMAKTLPVVLTKKGYH
jgi:lipopolysaccharide/colanic/teichoic acid biosynthesis glycosyltransferase